MRIDLYSYGRIQETEVFIDIKQKQALSGLWNTAAWLP